MVAYADAAGARPLYPQGSPTSRLFFLVLGSGVRVLAGRAGVAETGRRPCQNYPIVRLGCMTPGRALGGDPLRGQYASPGTWRCREQRIRFRLQDAERTSRGHAT